MTIEAALEALRGSIDAGPRVPFSTAMEVAINVAIAELTTTCETCGGDEVYCSRDNADTKRCPDCDTCPDCVGGVVPIGDAK